MLDVEDGSAAGASPAGGVRVAAALGPWLVAFTGWVLVASGLFALALTASVNLPPHDVAYLGMTHAQLCDFHSCRVARFMAHDRVAFGGSIIAIGILYHWLARDPLRRGRAWAWWTLFFSGLLRRRPGLPRRHLLARWPPMGAGRSRSSSAGLLTDMTAAEKPVRSGVR